jgi:hypothetical protein
MFRSIYHAAFQRGIAPAVLDASPLHVVAWALEGQGDEQSGARGETPDELRALYLERERARAEGRLDEWYVTSDEAVRV